MKVQLRQSFCWAAIATFVIPCGSLVVSADDWSASSRNFASVQTQNVTDGAEQQSSADAPTAVPNTPVVGNAASSPSVYGRVGCDTFSGCGQCDGFGCNGGCDGLHRSRGLLSGCGWLGGWNDRGGLLGFGIVKPSEQCFDDFISPLSNPVFFEDPRTLTEVRLIFAHNRLPLSLGGDSIQAYAPQFRIALSQRLSLIVTKGSIIDTDSPLFHSGYLDLAGGFKYNVYRDPNAGRILSAGMTFEAPSGSRDALQGNGDGEFHFFLTGGTRVLGSRRAHWLSTVGLRQPVDENAENQLMHWSNHFDYLLGIGRRPLYAFTEVNWWNYLSDGAAFPMPLEGGDIFNFGSPGVAGHDLVSQAVGLKSKWRSNIEAGIAYEFPLTERQGIMRDRLSLDLIVRY